MDSVVGLALQIAILVALLGGLIVAYLTLRQSRKGEIKVENEWRGEVDSDRKQFREFMAEVRKDLREIREEMADIYRRLPPRSADNGNPHNLTDPGRDEAPKCRPAHGLSRRPNRRNRKWKAVETAKSKTFALTTPIINCQTK